MLSENFKSWIFWILVICCGVVICAVAASMLSIRLNYERNFQVLEGKLVAVDEWPEDRGFWRSPRFTFKSHSGELVKFRSALGHVWLNYDVLDEVTILYDPNSKEAVMAGFEELYVPVVFFAFAGIVVLGVFVIFPLWLYQYLYLRNDSRKEVHGVER
jgi:hypothetical protein